MYSSGVYYGAVIFLAVVGSLWRFVLAGCGLKSAFPLALLMRLRSPSQICPRKWPFILICALAFISFKYGFGQRCSEKLHPANDAKKYWMRGCVDVY